MIKLHPNIIFYAILAVTLGQISTDIYLPSLPDMASEFMVPAHAMQFTLTVFLLGYAVSMFIYGPISDVIGRRPVLVYGLLLYLTGVVMCMMAQSAEWVIVGRLIQGLGIGSGAVTGRAMIRDSYSGNNLLLATAMASMAYTLSPMFAPSVGGMIHDWLGWRWVFALLLIYGVILSFFIFRTLPETNKNKLPGDHYVSRFFQNYKFVLTHTSFLANGLCVMLSYANIIAFHTVAPFLFQNVLGYSATRYGLTILLVPTGYLMGNYFASKMVKKLGVKSLMQFGAKFQLLGAFLMLSFALMGQLNSFVLIIPTMLMSLGSGLFNPGAMTSMMMPFHNHAGTAGAAMGTLTVFGAALSSWLLAMISGYTQFPLGMLWMVAALTTNILLYRVIGQFIGHDELLQDD